MKSLFKKIIVKILILESRIILKKYKPYIIAVTGSVGKTSTKDAIYTVLADNCYIRKSEKSFNSEIGIPLTVLGVQNAWNDPFLWLKNIFEGIELIIFKTEYPKCLVLEIGADHPGDIKNITKWLKPDIAVITRVGEVPVHVEFFNSPEDVLNEKFFLARALKADGTLIISSDDKRLTEASKNIKQRVITFGIENAASVSASDIRMDIHNGISFKLNFEGNSLPVNLTGVLGNQQVYPLIAAISVGIVRGVNIVKLAESFSKHIPPRGRMNIIKGLNGSFLIDDTYNSSPDALHEALKTLTLLQTSGKKIAILGDMMELGKFSADEHKKAGELALKSCDILITVGPRAKLMVENAKNFSLAIEAGEYIKKIVAVNDIVLLKGSQSIRLERATQVLLDEPERDSELLVRQEDEWLAKK
jgi:UDP-N-acetylmuramoyl-tripeptide--D-alanyl-D-alanine ligase